MSEAYDVILYKDLDPGIRKVVLRLNDAGFKTTDSGDGVSKLGGELDHDNEVLPMPHVHMTTHTPYGGIIAAAHLVKVVLSWGVKEVMSGQIQLTYDPVDRTTILSLYSVDDSMLGDDDDE